MMCVKTTQRKLQSQEEALLLQKDRATR